MDASFFILHLSQFILMSSRPLKVFLCHAHADRDRVRALRVAARLTKAAQAAARVQNPLIRYAIC
jgi:hypothetical protein